MTYEEARQKLEKFGQLHVLRYWDELTGEQAADRVEKRKEAKVMQ